MRRRRRCTARKIGKIIKLRLEGEDMRNVLYEVDVLGIIKEKPFKKSL